MAKNKKSEIKETASVTKENTAPVVTPVTAPVVVEIDGIKWDKSCVPHKIIQ